MGKLSISIGEFILSEFICLSIVLSIIPAIFQILKNEKKDKGIYTWRTDNNLQERFNAK